MLQYPCPGCPEKGRQPEENFYAGSKYCKECKKKASRENRKAKQTYYNEYDHQRKSKHGRRLSGRLSPEERDRRIRARKAVGNAIRDGRLLKQPCEVCGEPEVEAHHDDYGKPLDVRWLCVPHHCEADAAMQQAVV